MDIQGCSPTYNYSERVISKGHSSISLEYSITLWSGVVWSLGLPPILGIKGFQHCFRMVAHLLFFPWTAVLPVTGYAGGRCCSEKTLMGMQHCSPFILRISGVQEVGPHWSHILANAHTLWDGKTTLTPQRPSAIFWRWAVRVLRLQGCLMILLQ